MHKRIEITRADYEALLGLRADPDTIGACLYGPDAKTILAEYLFIEPHQEIAILEAMYRA